MKEMCHIDLYYDGELHHHILWDGELCTFCAICDACSEDLYTE